MGMEDEHDKNYWRAVMHGIESDQTIEIYRAIRAARQYVRRHGAPEGLFVDYGTAMDMKQRISIAWESLEQLDSCLKQFGLIRNTLWVWPTCVLVIGHEKSKQWISVRAHAIAQTGIDIPTARLLCVNGALQCLLGAANQPEFFEQAVHDLAYRTLGLGEV